MNTQKRCPFHYRLLECKSRKSRNIWSNRQIWPWSTERSRAKANRVFPRERTGHSKHPLPTTQEKTHTWTSPGGQHRDQIDYLFCSQKRRSSIQSAKTRPEADCGSDHELLTVKFRLRLKKVGKTTRPFRYDLNQISYDDTVEVTNRFNGLDLIDRVSKELWMEVGGIVQETPQEKEMQKSKMAVWGGLTNSYEKKRREEKSKAKEKSKDIPIWMQSSKE